MFQISMSYTIVQMEQTIIIIIIITICTVIIIIILLHIDKSAKLHFFMRFTIHIYNDIVLKLYTQIKPHN